MTLVWTKNFLDNDLESTGNKRRNRQVDVIKLRSPCTAKEKSTKLTKSTQLERKYLQAIHQIDISIQDVLETQTTA
jgi:hypothetical protein